MTRRRKVLISLPAAYLVLWFATAKQGPGALRRQVEAERKSKVAPARQDNLVGLGRG